MDVNNENVIDQVDWLCPVCNASKNSLGIDFSGSRAVALHVAGKIRSGDSKHKSWAISKVGERIHDSFVKYSINTLADELEWYVIEANNARRQYAEEKIKRSIAEREDSEEPRVLAYKYIQKIETDLHEFVRLSLQISFGAEENGWWVKGVPLQIRIECAQRREEDLLREEPYNYTDLIDLKTIIDKNWSIFDNSFQRIREQCYPKKEFLADIARCNELRKRVMHPIRMSLSDDDISFLQRFNGIIDVFIREDQKT